MSRIAIVYHSEKNRTRDIAHEVERGAQSVAGTDVHVMSVDNVDWQILEQADAIIFGCPTYMGSASAQFKKFMDESGMVWMRHGWKNKLAAGFVTSYGYSGDKLNVLVQLAIYAAQHAMIWIGSGDAQQGNSPQDINRVGSFLGVMAQSDSTLDSVEPPSGDRKTAFNLGVRVAEFAHKLR